VRVLHIHSGNLWGGIESFLATLARSRSEAGDLESEFAVCFAGRLRDELTSAGAVVHDLEPVRTRAPWTVFGGRRRLERVLARGAFDVVVTHSPWSQAVFGGTAASSGATGVFWLHDAVTGKHWLERWAARHRPKFAIANSHYTLETLAALFGGIPSVVHRYPVAFPSTPLTSAERASVRAELGAGEDTVVVLQASRMQAWKGQHRLLHALAAAGRSEPWLCVQVGGAQRASEDAYVNELKALAARLGIADRVRFLGQRSDVPRLLLSADVFCQPNAGPEPFGIVFVEALLAGLPIVTTDFGGAREIVTPEVGYLTQGDGMLAEVLGRLVRDRELRQRLGGAGPSRARLLCDPQQQVSGLTQLLARIRNAEKRSDGLRAQTAGAS
jgi:glycosyltransferase involved in cell wall biosynthesis